MPIQAERLNNYMENFFGYGNISSPWWFIGLEEGSSGLEKEINARLDVWMQLGSATTCDCADFHIRMAGILNEQSNLFPPENLPDSRVKLQPTWRRLLQVFFSAHNKHPNPEIYRYFQRNELGRMKDNNPIALLELYPLPKQNVAAWPYNNWVVPPQRNLIDRETYYGWATPWRCATIGKLINNYSPQVVVFYGTTATEKWLNISRLNGQPVRFEGQLTTSRQHFKIAIVNNTIFAIIPHPAARGVRSADWDEFGQAIRIRKIPSRSTTRTKTMTGKDPRTGVVHEINEATAEDLEDYKRCKKYLEDEKIKKEEADNNKPVFPILTVISSIFIIFVIIVWLL
jgi:hypothetical protein